MARIGFDCVDVFTEAREFRGGNRARGPRVGEIEPADYLIAVVSVGPAISTTCPEFHVERTKKLSISPLIGAQKLLLVLGEYIWQREVIPAAHSGNGGLRLVAGSAITRRRRKSISRWNLDVPPQPVNSVDSWCAFGRMCAPARARDIDISHLVLSDTTPADVKKLKGKAFTCISDDCDGKCMAFAAGPQAW